MFKYFSHVKIITAKNSKKNTLDKNFNMGAFEILFKIGINFRK